jgi:hypothetical protein
MTKLDEIRWRHENGWTCAGCPSRPPDVDRLLAEVDRLNAREKELMADLDHAAGLLGDAILREHGVIPTHKHLEVADDQT